MVHDVTACEQARNLCLRRARFDLDIAAVDQIEMVFEYLRRRRMTDRDKCAVDRHMAFFAGLRVDQVQSNQSHRLTTPDKALDIRIPEHRNLGIGK